jgi:hypothetical protein
MQSSLPFFTDTDAATVTMDFNESVNHLLVAGGNRTLVFSNPSAGATYTIRITQDATGSRTITWPTTVKWAGGSAPTLTSTASRTDDIVLLYDGAFYSDLSITKNKNLA